MVALTGASQTGHQALNPAWPGEHTCAEWKRLSGLSGLRKFVRWRKFSRFPRGGLKKRYYVRSVIIGACGGNASAEDVDDGRGPHRTAGSHWRGSEVISFSLSSFQDLFREVRKVRAVKGLSLSQESVKYVARFKDSDEGYRMKTRENYINRSFSNTCRKEFVRNITVN